MSLGSVNVSGLEHLRDVKKGGLEREWEHEKLVI